MQTSTSHALIRVVALACLLATCLATTVQLKGQVSILTGRAPDGSDAEFYFLNVAGQQGLKRLLFSTKPTNLLTGNVIAVTATVPDARTAAAALSLGTESRLPETAKFDVLVVNSYQVQEALPVVSGALPAVGAPGQDVVTANVTTVISSITWLTQICGVLSVKNVSMFKQQWTNNFATGDVNKAFTMQNYYTSCSQGQVTFDAANNIIVDLTKVNVPCTGTYNGQTWNASKCGTAEIYGWQKWVQDYTVNTLKINITKYARRVMVMPNNAACPWAGLAAVGCGYYCNTWLKGGMMTNNMPTPTQPNWYMMNSLQGGFHELGHNLGLQHSNLAPNVEYGDASCAMGSCCGTRCFNAPQAWKLGWYKPKYTITNTSLTHGRWSDYVIPATNLDKTNFIRIVPNWNNGATTPAYFLSYRQRTQQGFDKGLQYKYTAGLSVHQFNGSQWAGGEKPLLMDTVGLGKWYNATGIKLRVQVRYMNSTHATVRMCRAISDREKTCNDGKDDDCNGLVDYADPACVKPAPKCVVDGVCSRSAGESNRNCPQDCPSQCGDGYCNTTRESGATCPMDCPAFCGDCYCDVQRGETARSCPHDCPFMCGDGFCDTARGENGESCPADCPVVCGDGYCDVTRPRPGRPSWDTEYAGNCPKDCAPGCGDAVCDNLRGENSFNCPSDCPIKCGDKFCDKTKETASNCPGDCGTILPAPAPWQPLPWPAPAPKCVQIQPPSGRRMLLEHAAQGAGSADDGADQQEVEEEPEPEFQAVVLTTSSCGDGICQSPKEDAASCPADCAPVCGDAICDKLRGESPFSCPADCKAEWCGDGVCGATETRSSCPADCCPRGRCGDGVCQVTSGENCMTCPQDCAGNLTAADAAQQFCCGAMFGCEDARCNVLGKLKCEEMCALE